MQKYVRKKEYCAQHGITYKKFNKTMIDGGHMYVAHSHIVNKGISSKKKKKSTFYAPCGDVRATKTVYGKASKSTYKWNIDDLDKVFGVTTDKKALTEVKRNYTFEEELMFKERAKIAAETRKRNKGKREELKALKEQEAQEIVNNTIEYTVPLNPKAWNDKYKDYTKHAQGVLEYLENNPDHQEKLSDGAHIKTNPVLISKNTEADIEKGTATVKVLYHYDK